MPNAAGGSQDDSTLLVRDVHDLERKVADRADRHAAAARLWRWINIVFGAPASVLAAVTAGGLALENKATLAGVFALAGGLTAVNSFLGAGRQSDSHDKARLELERLAAEAHVFGVVSRWPGATDAGDALATYKELYERFAQIEQTAPSLGRSRRAVGRRPAPAGWHRPATIAAAGVAAAALAAGGGLWAAGVLGGGGGVNEGSQGARTASSDERLAGSLAPVLRLSSGERFFPMDRSAFVSVANVVRKIRFFPLKVLPFDHTIGGFPGKVKCPAALSCTYALDIARLTPWRDKPAAYADRLKSLYPNGWDPVVYWHVVRYPTGAAAVQYWLLFFYNNFLNQHEADWEQVTLEVSSSGQPVRAFYSSHQGGERSLWATLPQAAGHPVVFVGGGSHANYFSAGKHDVQIVRASRKLVVKDTADGCGRLLAPAQIFPVAGSVEADCAARGKPLEEARTYRLAELTAPAFPGFYGYGNYVMHGLIRVGNGPGEPQRRAAWDDPLSLFGKAPGALQAT